MKTGSVTEFNDGLVTVIVTKIDGKHYVDIDCLQEVLSIKDRVISELREKVSKLQKELSGFNGEYNETN